MDLIDTWMVDLAGTTAHALEARAADEGLLKVNEQHHLQPACAATAREFATTQKPAPTVSTQDKRTYADWPRLGGVDVVIAWETGKAAIELKCGCGKDGIAPCAWDAAKLAFVRAHEEFAACYLLAGAPSSDWAAGVRGSGFFADSTWTAEHVRDVYTDWFRFWEKDGYRPLRVPTAFETRYLGAFPFAVAESSWELRLARVECTANVWFEWKSLVADKLCDESA